jgi:transposase
VHLVVDALGLPVAYELTVGERHDAVPAVDLILRAGATTILADKGYDSNEIRSQLAAQDIASHIPPRKNRIAPIDYDKSLYRARYEVECTFNLLKQARRFATRYEKTLRNYGAMVALSCILCWLRI